MRVAAIDLGTNSIHMIVAEVRSDRSFEVIDREKDMIRLGAGGLDGRGLSETAMATAHQTLAKFRRIAESHRVDEIVAAATSAVREAKNGGDFLAAVYRETGIRVRVISGTEEARLIHLAASYGVDFGTGTAVVVDIGGGSIEITLGPSGRAQIARSFKLGVLRVVDRFVQSDPLARREERRLVRYVTRETRAALDEIVRRGFERVIGTSGTILSLGALAARDERGVPDDRRNRRVDAKAFHRLRKELVALDLEQRLALPGLDPQRADVAAVGAVVFDTILRRLGAKTFTLCDLALREGLVLDYIRRNASQIEHVERYPDVRRRSVIELAERCQYAPEHARQVASLALALFDQTRGVHALTDREREWLEYASLLHDIGMHISYERHHRHSYYLIKNGDLRGFEPDEIEMIALIARYHRRATPKKSHEGFADRDPRDRRTIRLLGAFLRLAEGLDRSHAQPVAGVQVQDHGGDYLMQLEPAGDAELELWAAARHVEPLAQVLGRRIRFELGTDAGRADTDHAHQSDIAAHLSRQALRRRGHRRVGQDHPARAAGQVAQRRRAPRVRH
jgi:exopolyphosphatase/guanosine-5'-triphosphate,3'-diphosphate pyrophosphatase